MSGTSVASGPAGVVRAWLPEAALVLAVVVSGYNEMVNTYVITTSGSRLPLVLVVVATAGTVALCRRAPALALALTWGLGAIQFVTDTQFLITQLAFAAVVFGAARWGTPLTAFLGGLSVPAAAALAVALAVVTVQTGDDSTVSHLLQNETLVDAIRRLSDSGRVGVGVAGMAILGIPWFAGLAFRFSDNARESRVSQVQAEETTARAVRESEQAREIARLRDEQARLARDVHDVVGHSLAVILAQAESAQYLPDADTDKLKQTMANIATSARSSLQDVRHVLTTAQEAHVEVAPRPLDTLVEGVRASGHEVVSRELGTPQPMPPELEVVAYRVLQEMLTNALKHGTRDEPVFVERLWPDGSWAGELRIEVRNSVDAAPPAPSDETQPMTVLGGPPPAADGRGLDGMRRRLEACGGRLDVRRREEPDGTTFTSTAWVPVRTPPLGTVPA